MPLEWPGPLRDFHLDANRINGSGRLKYVNELELWRERGVIMLGVSEVVNQEVIHSDPTGRRGKKARMETRTETLATTPQEKKQLRRIRTILFGDTELRDQGEWNDVEALFNAKKYCRIFVTADGVGGKERGILTRREELKNFGIIVMTDHEAVVGVRRALRVKARNKREICALSGTPEPEWIAVFEGEDLRNPV